MSHGHEVRCFPPNRSDFQQTFTLGFMPLWQLTSNDEWCNCPSPAAWILVTCRTWMLDDIGTWLGRWMKLHESGWNDGWTGDMLEKSRLGGHEQRGFDFRHPCVWHGKKQQLLAFTKIIENAIKARFHSRGTWHFFLVREFPASPFLKSWGLWGPQTFCPSLRFLLEL